MKITNNPNIQKIMGVYKKNIEGSQKTSKISQEKDKIEISNKAKDFQLALNAYKNLPEVRQNKVDELSKQIKSGTYKPKGDEIVDSMFDRKI